MMENICIKSPNLKAIDLENIFWHEQIYFTDTKDFQTLVVELGLYKSKSAAMRDGREGPIPSGYTEYKATKKQKLYIWNPSGYEN